MKRSWSFQQILLFLLPRLCFYPRQIWKKRKGDSYFIVHTQHPGGCKTKKIFLFLLRALKNLKKKT